MNKVSLVLFIIQALAIVGAIVGGSFFEMRNAFAYIGFFLPAIVGVILMFVKRKKSS